MQTFTVHLPRDARPDERRALERADLVKEGFCLGAFVFTFLWFFWHRLWLAGLLVLVVVVGFTAGLAVLDIAGPAALLAEALLALLIGLEASALRRWTYARRGRPPVDVVTARNRQEAELKAVSRALAAAGAAAALPSAAPSPLGFRGPEGVIGLFPDPERG